MDGKSKDQIAAEIAAEYRETIRRTADEELRSRRSGAGRKSIRVAYLLWFLFGGFGAHRFYLGHVLSGAGMLVLGLGATAFSLLPLLFVFGIPLGAMVGLWWLIDAFLIPHMIPDGPAE